MSDSRYHNMACRHWPPGAVIEVCPVRPLPWWQRLLLRLLPHPNPPTYPPPVSGPLGLADLGKAG